MWHRCVAGDRGEHCGFQLNWQLRLAIAVLCIIGLVACTRQGVVEQAHEFHFSRSMLDAAQPYGFPDKKDVRIFMYSLPSKFTTEIIRSNQMCSKGIFSAEIELHRWLLNSPYKTSDPHLADYYFIPVYSSCYLTTQRKLEQEKRLNPHHWQRKLLAEALTWLENHSEYGVFFRRNRGHDHLLMATHDFGRCLTYRDKGYTVWSDGLENFSSVLQNMVFVQYNGEWSKKSSCYKKGQDIVIPPVSSFSNTQLSGAAYYKAGEDQMSYTNLATVFFRGTISWKWFGKEDASYSKGLRQTLYSLYGPTGGDSTADLTFHLYDSHTSLVTYFSELNNARFCLCPRGYATWSPRLVDAILAACIPVIIADNTDWPFQNSLHYEKFAIIVSEADAIEHGRLARILSRMSLDELKSKMAALRMVLPFFRYNTSSHGLDKSSNYNGDYFIGGNQSSPSMITCGACSSFIRELSERLVGP